MAAERLQFTIKGECNPKTDTLRKSDFTGRPVNAPSKSPKAVLNELSALQDEVARLKQRSRNSQNSSSNPAQAKPKYNLLRVLFRVAVLRNSTSKHVARLTSQSERVTVTNALSRAHLEAALVAEK